MSYSGFFPPYGYISPTWPSLYWPFAVSADDYPRLLFLQNDIVLFTLYWSLLVFGITYGMAALWGFFVFYPSYRRAFGFCGAYAGIGLLTGTASGLVIGGVLYAFYNAGLFPMQTWIPLAWSIVAGLFMIIASYPEVTFTTL